MDEQLSSAREDLSLIRSMLAQTMTGLRELAGFFNAYGWIWLAYAAAITVENAVTSALYVTGTPEYRLGYYTQRLRGPLLLTAVFAEDRRMLLLGLAAFAFGLARMAMPFQWLSIGIRQLGQLAWAVSAWLLLQGFPGLLLLAFGHLLKKDKTHGAA